jgi:hypothetical protein
MGNLRRDAGGPKELGESKKRTHAKDVHGETDRPGRWVAGAAWKETNLIRAVVGADQAADRRLRRRPTAARPARPAMAAKAEGSGTAVTELKSVPQRISSQEAELPS